MPGLLGRHCNIYPVHPGCWIFCRIKNYRDKRKKEKKVNGLFFIKNVTVLKAMYGQEYLGYILKLINLDCYIESFHAISGYTI